MDNVRVLRVLEYVGERALVEKTLSEGGVPANGQYGTTKILIRSATLGQYPEVLGEFKESPTESVEGRCLPLVSQT